MDILNSLSSYLSKNIEIKDLENFTSKIKHLITSYKTNHKNLVLVTDFDFTITKRFNYQKDISLFS